MKRINKLYSVLAIFALSISSIAAVQMAATSWTVDDSHSSVTFEVRHFFAKIPGEFKDFDATINFDPESLGDSKIDVTIPIASINTDNERRDGHLQTADFFEAETYPNMTFTSKTIEKTGENTYVAKGTLTIKDVSKDFELPFTVLGMMDHPMRENAVVAGISSEFQILRNDYGVGTGDYVSDAVIGNEVDVTINLELNATK